MVKSVECMEVTKWKELHCFFFLLQSLKVQITISKEKVGMKSSPTYAYNGVVSVVIAIKVNFCKNKIMNFFPREL